ncbi:MAG: hypothetical protein LBR58_09055 [Propionibacteriaceae bacterium]|jgi:hypothetical protein|nr:hypothetical protein [Propionibacteriaceae bacterium]
MGKRLFWLAVGVGLTAVVVLKGKQIYEKFTPAGIAQRVDVASNRLRVRAGEFVTTFTTAMEEREAELREVLEID